MLALLGAAASATLARDPRVLTAAASATLAGGPFDSGVLTAEPIWAGAENSRFALFRRELELPSDRVLYAQILVTAVQSGLDEKLLGAYRLYVGGVAIGIGPGRGGNIIGANHTYLDEFNVTALVRAAQKSSTLVLGLQCYHESGNTSSGVLLELRLHLANGLTSSVGTSSSGLSCTSTHSAARRALSSA